MPLSLSAIIPSDLNPKVFPNCSIALPIPVPLSLTISLSTPTLKTAFLYFYLQSLLFSFSLSTSFPMRIEPRFPLAPAFSSIFRHRTSLLVLPYFSYISFFSFAVIYRPVSLLCLMRLLDLSCTATVIRAPCIA